MGYDDLQGPSLNITKVRQLLSAHKFPRDCGAKERDNVPSLPFHTPITHNLFQILFFTVSYREHLKIQNMCYRTL